jgi:hypothetical protein
MMGSTRAGGDPMGCFLDARTIMATVSDAKKRAQKKSYQSVLCLKKRNQSV